MPQSHEKLEGHHVNQFIRAMKLIRNDIFFLLNYAFDQLMSPTCQLSQSFLHEAQKISKLAYVATIFSLARNPGFRTAHEPGYHWIVIVVDIQASSVMFYDPTSNGTFKPNCFPAEFKAMEKFMKLLKGPSYALQRSHFKFETRCQNVSEDSIHCGLWSCMFMIAWCLGPEALISYDAICSQKSTVSGGLPSLALKFRQRLCSDIVRHQLLDVTFFDIWKSPSIEITNAFWTEIPLMNISAYLQLKYGSIFTEVMPSGNGKKGYRWLALPKLGEQIPNDSKNPMFFRDGIRCVKVYRFLWGCHAHSALGLALHEAAATAYVCPQRNWEYEVFGVVTTGVCASYVHICLLRTELESADITPAETSAFIIGMFEELGVVHGDGHNHNVLRVRFGRMLQAIDFERSFIPASDLTKDEICETIREFATNEATRCATLERIVKQGLDRTRKNFAKIASAPNLFALGIKEFIDVFLSTKSLSSAERK
jgi:hypothetical protein